MYTNNSVASQPVNKFSKEEELQLWMQYEAYLKQQIKDFECGTSDRETKEEYSKYTEEEENEILERIDQLKTKLLDATNSVSLKEMLLTNIDLAASFKEELSLSKEPHSQSNELLKLATTRDELALNHIKLVEGITQNKRELLRYQLDNQEILAKNQQIMREIIDLELNEQKSEVTGNDNLKEIREKYEISRNVLQNIILESGVNWSNDEHLMDLMLMIGDE